MKSHQIDKILPSVFSSAQDTIAAISTGFAVSGIGIVRISGKEALRIADKIFVSKKKLLPSEFKSYTLHYGWIRDPDSPNRLIDEVLLSVMRAPFSYTREDVVEINCHGGILAQRRILELVLSQGARLAEPGEFTKRAFLNGRIDLAQAEAVLDIVRAQTDAALDLGENQLKGLLSEKLNRTKELLMQALVRLEANIDFPEEELDGLDLGECRQQIKEANDILTQLVKTSHYGRLLRQGVKVVICGRPNVGKSSLINRLLKEERSIVSSIAGTTRDTIEETVDIGGLAVKLVDTAGILKPRNIIEKKAVLRSWEKIKEADLVILVFDGSHRLTDQDKYFIQRLGKKSVLAVINKVDKKQCIEKDALLKRFPNLVEISVRKDRNIELLEKRIQEIFLSGHLTSAGSFCLANLRHIQLVKKAQKFIAHSLDSIDNRLSLEYICEDLKDGLACLDEILGRRFSEELLDRIFSQFCIGK